MEFYLTYEGALKASANAKEKHKIRQYIEPQLRRLWDLPPLNYHKEWLSPKPLSGEHNVIKDICGYKFAPLVTKNLHLVCQLDIVLLWSDEQGKIIGSGGDIDNRLKTFFDALACPDANQVAKIVKEIKQEGPFFCLLEDDKLIISVNVKTDTFLCAQNNSDVSILLNVKTKAVKLTMDNIDVSG